MVADTFILSYTGYSWTAKPQLNGSTLNWVGDDYRYDLRKEWNGELIFTDIPKDGVQDYSVLASITDPSTVISVDVYKDGNLHWEGQFTRYDCYFDEDAGIVKVQPVPVDYYTDFIAGYEQEVNLFTGGKLIFGGWRIDRKELNSPQVTYPVETIEKNYWNVLAGPPTTMTGAVDANYYLKSVVRYEILGVNYNRREYWKREYRLETSASVPSGWNSDPLGATTVVGGVTYYKFVRPWMGLTVSSTFTKTTANPPNAYPIVVFTIVIPQVASVVYDRCFLLNDAMENLLEDFSLGYRSDFFQNAINPVTGATSKTANILMAQKSDIKRPGDSDPATKANMSPYRLITLMCDIFNLRWFIEPYTTPSGQSALRLRIEHISWFSKQNGVDISAGKYTNYTRSQNKYTYMSPPPRYEKWTFMEEGGDDFVGTPIEYPYIKNTERKDIERSIDIITTDIQYIQEYVDKISDEGFVMFSATNSGTYYRLNTDIGRISGAYAWNGAFSKANILYDYWRHDRPFPTGQMNGASITFISTQKVKEQVELTIPLLEPIATNKLLKTGLGWGEIYEAVEDLEMESLKLKLRYA